MAVRQPHLSRSLTKSLNVVILSLADETKFFATFMRFNEKQMRMVANFWKTVVNHAEVLKNPSLLDVQLACNIFLEPRYITPLTRQDTLQQCHWYIEYFSAESDKSQIRDALEIIKQFRDREKILALPDGEAEAYATATKDMAEEIDQQFEEKFPALYPEIKISVYERYQARKQEGATEDLSEAEAGDISSEQYKEDEKVEPRDKPNHPVKTLFDEPLHDGIVQRIDFWTKGQWTLVKDEPMKSGTGDYLNDLRSKEGGRTIAKMAQFWTAVTTSFPPLRAVTNKELHESQSCEASRVGFEFSKKYKPGDTLELEDDLAKEPQALLDCFKLLGLFGPDFEGNIPIAEKDNQGLEKISVQPQALQNEPPRFDNVDSDRVVAT
ncbi:hypothetical protein R3P38DRAFT_2795361 [Favolaschia claudopus]|uniref:Uncharacterized protein n=1 Tax=Favolaschia claudopus TaxID=2862362 RepID=A0AAW0A7M5_9AGAR